MKKTGGQRGEKSLAVVRRNRRIGYLFLLPNLIGFVIFTFIPVVFAFALSLMEWDSSNPMKFVGLRNFVDLLHDSTFHIALKNTIVYTLGTVPGIVIISMFLAILLNKGIKAAPLFRAAHYIPYISSMVAVSIVWQFLYNPEMGPINQALRLLGVTDPPRWLSSAKWAMFSVILVSIWRNVGRYMIIYLGGLQGVPKSLYEASTIDGASKWQQIRYITIPLLSSTTFLVLITNIIGSFQVFSNIYIMTDGGPGRSTNVLVYLIYQEAFVNSKFGYASAMSVVLFAFVFVFTLIQFRGKSKWVYD